MSTLLRVLRWGTPNKFAEVENGATKGSELGVNLTYQGRVLLASEVINQPTSGDGGTGGYPVTLWDLIQNIPPNVTALANTSTTGLYTITGTGTSATRTIQDGPGIDWTNPGGVAGDPQATFNSHTAPVDRIDGSTYSTVQDYVNTMTSPGTIDGPAKCIVESGIPATPIRVLAGKGMIRTADDDVSSLPFFDWSETDFAQPSDGLTRFYGVVYNGGTPIVQQRTTYNWDKDTEIPLGSAVIFASGVAVITPNPYKTGDADTNIIQRFDAQAPAIRDNSIGGLILGETGTRNATLTGPAKIWSRLSDFDVAAKNSATSPMLSAFFNGTGLTVASGLTQWDNTRYNNVGAGTLVAMGLNKYANLWFFISIDGTKWGFAYGTNEYNTLGAAANEGVPAYLNQNFFQQALLLGRLIFQQGAATASLIESAFQQIFSTTAINNHNDLSGLQVDGGSVPGEFYHLSNSQATAVANAVGAGGGFVTIAGTQSITGAKSFTQPVAINSMTLSEAGGTGSIESSRVAGNVTVNFSPTPLDVVSAALFRIFRTTNTAGMTSFDVCFGDGSSSLNHSFSGKGSHSFISRVNGNVSVGSSADNASAKLQVNGHINSSTNFGSNNGTTSFRWAATFTRDIVLGANAASLGGGVGVMFLSNATTAPTTNPAGGAIIYAEAGASKVRGTSGTVTTFGPADPHCPRCGSDFVREYESPVYGYLARCDNCAADGVNSHTRIKGEWSTH